MRIAVPLENDQVADHMGHCPKYLIAEIVDNAVASTIQMTNPRHGPGGPPPVFLATHGVSHVVGRGAPDHFLAILSQLNITYTLGATGTALQVLNDYLAGTLVLSQDGIQVDCGHH